MRIILALGEGEEEELIPVQEQPGLQNGSLSQKQINNTNNSKAWSSQNINDI